MNMACEYTVGPEMHPFAFRVHTHKLGKSQSRLVYTDKDPSLPIKSFVIINLRGAQQKLCFHQLYDFI